MKNNFLYTLFTFFLPFLMWSQALIKVEGTVKDKQTGEPLPGVEILLVGTQRGTVTDFEGRFVLDKVPEGARLKFNYLGYKPVIMEATASPLLVFMEPAAEELEKVVIVGYGAEQKKDLTGTVNKLSAKDFDKGNVTNVENLLTGKIAGVTVIAPSGAPGEGASINIRGLSSLSLTNEPLFVVDGIPLGGGVAGSRNPLNFLNPNDIESIVILKDASATAIYGSRAANGVVLITTKKGKNKKFTYNFSVQSSFSYPYRFVNVMSSYEFRRVVNDIGNTQAQSLLGNANTDWQREIFAPAVGQEYYLSGNGQLFHFPVRISLGYTNQNGILQRDNFERVTASINIRPQWLDGDLKMDINTHGYYTENFFANRGAIGSAIVFDPTQPVYDPNSPFDGYFAWVDPSSNPPVQYNLAPVNPVALINLTDDFSFVKKWVGNIKTDYKLPFLKDITATLNLGIDRSYGKGHTIVSDKMPTSDASWQGIHNTYNNTIQNQLLDLYFTYSKQLKNHKLKFMSGYSYQKFYYEHHFYDDYAFQHGNPDYNKIDKSAQVMISYFGRLNYKFSDRFLLTASLRADASSLLNPKDRWGLFPSVAFAWNIHNENFMKDKGFDELKLRIGYGSVGNVNGLAPYKYLTRYQVSTSTAQYQFGNQFYPTYRPEPVNKDLRWEIGTTTNIGLDFSVWDKRFSGSLNLYQKETKDLIIWALVDPFTNFGNRVEKNVGNMLNKGVELELNVIPLKNDKTQWQVSYNIAYNDNKVTFMPFDQEVGGIEGGVGNTVQLHTEGQAPYSFYVYQQVYDSNGKPLEGVLVDRNGDGVINNKDKYFFKDPYADILMGLSSKWTYGRFEMGISMRVSIGNYMYNNVASSKSIPANINNFPFLTNLHRDYFNTEFQTFSETNLLSDYYVTDASFLKIDNIHVGYSFPRVADKLNLRIYAAMQNVATFTAYQGLDPEIPGGIDNVFYPRPRIFTFGVNMDF